MAIKSQDKEILDSFFKTKNNNEYKYNENESKKIVKQLFEDKQCKALLDYLADK